MNGIRIFLVFYLALICLKHIFRKTYQPKSGFEGFLYIIWKKEKLQEFFKDFVTTIVFVIISWVLGFSLDPFYMVLTLFVTVGIQAYQFKKHRNFSVFSYIEMLSKQSLEAPTASKVYDALINLGKKHPELQYGLLKMVTEEIISDFQGRDQYNDLTIEENNLYQIIKDNRIFSSDLSFEKNFQMLLKISETEGMERMVAINDYVTLFVLLG